MTSTAQAQQAAPIPAPPTPRPLRRRPSKMLILAGVLLAALCSTGAVFVHRGVDDTVPAVGMASPVRYGQIITEQALLQVEVLPGHGVELVPWDERSQVVGKRATTDLWPGVIVTPGGVRGELAPTVGQQLVGVAVKAAQIPATPLEPRQPVLLVPSNQAGSAAELWEPVRATVVRVGERDSSGIRVVDVVVPERSGAQLATRASTGSVAIVLLSGS